MTNKRKPSSNTGGTPEKKEQRRKGPQVQDNLKSDHSEPVEKNQDPNMALVTVEALNTVIVQLREAMDLQTMSLEKCLGLQLTKLQSELTKHQSELKEDFKVVKDEIVKIKEEARQTMIDELHEREMKRLEIIILDMEETGLVAPSERGKLEKGKAFDKLKAFSPSLENEDLLFTRRMGKAEGRKPEDKPRPMLVRFKYEADRQSVLKGADKAKDRKVRPCLTKSQLERRKGLYLDKAAKNEKNSIPGKEWVVMGAPGREELRLMKKK